MVGWSRRGGARASAAVAALDALLEELPFFPGRPVERWEAGGGSSAAAWVAHDDGLDYARAGERRLALFSGRPILWSAEERADGRTPATAAWFDSPPPDWLERLDGRFAAVRCDGAAERVELVTDAMGAYPLYRAAQDGVLWFSNSAAALRQLAAPSGYRLDSLAGLLGGGWPLEGHPIWAGIDRVEPGSVLTLGPAGELSRTLLPLPELAALPGAGLEPELAARRVVAAVGALADWPGRPSVVPVTGGRDSRVVLAAALAAGFGFDARTGGAPADPDVESAAALCHEAGIAHGLLEADPHGSVWSDHREAARIVRLVAGGTATLADAAGFPLGPRDGPLPLWHSGQGGEIGRAYYGPGAGLDADGLADRLYTAFTARRPHRPEPLSRAGEALVRDSIRSWVGGQLAAGVAAGDVPDMFYVQRRMATWAAPTHGAVEYVRDTTSPLWSRRVLGDLLGPKADERAGEAYHREVLGRLAPALARLPFADGTSWAAPRGRIARRVRGGRSLAGKAAAELRRRAGRHAGAAAPDPFDAVIADVREQALSRPSHPAWQVIDRPRCERLLARPAASLDDMSRYHVWRLATVFVE